MTWHIEVVDADHFGVMLSAIRRTGGTVTRSCPCADGYAITYVTLD
ncbi:MAG: hypothetical protein JWR35_811 [Marmoricola sp.]|jgi:hypothetical protein|nr:hypothetical protein [Marmoricola sp.]